MKDLDLLIHTARTPEEKALAAAAWRPRSTSAAANPYGYAYPEAEGTREMAGW